MAITFVAKGSNLSSSGSFVLALPSGWAEDDLIVLVVESSGTDGDPGTVTGYTRVNGVYNAG